MVHFATLSKDFSFKKTVSLVICRPPKVPPPCIAGVAGAVVTPLALGGKFSLEDGALRGGGGVWALWGRGLFGRGDLKGINFYFILYFRYFITSFCFAESSSRPSHQKITVAIGPLLCSHSNSTLSC